jgi:hypothetical protein
MHVAVFKVLSLRIAHGWAAADVIRHFQEQGLLCADHNA